MQNSIKMWLQDFLCKLFSRPIIHAKMKGVLFTARDEAKETEIQ